MIAGSSMLSGCSYMNVGASDYSCDGSQSTDDKSLKCMSVSEVYERTNNGDVPQTNAEGVIVSNDSGVNAKSVKVDPIIQKYVSARLPNDDVPIRTPASVMKIWVAPYETTNGDLIVSGYIFTEIEQRRWVIGETHLRNDGGLTPLRNR